VNVYDIRLKDVKHQPTIYPGLPLRLGTL